MDPLRLVARVACTFVVALLLIRISGRRSVRQSDLSSFVVAVVLGDLFDDMIWAEVPASGFVVAASTIVSVHLAAHAARTSGGTRQWRRASTGTRR
jgi:uncharacterized membrane protein YcaP (DUF421 family)